MTTLADTISALTKTHLLERSGLLFGQCLTAVGRVAGTIPDMLPCTNPSSEGGIVELPTCDVAGPGFVVGAALAGRRPIFVCRYQGFMTYNLASLVNYAAKSKSMWGVPCPVFIRAIAMEGGIGPVAGGSHHSMAMRMPGIKVVAPMTPGEWTAAWNDFLAGDDPVYCSEHRLSFKQTDEMPAIRSSRPLHPDNPDVVLIGISAGRLSILEAAKFLEQHSLYACGVHHIDHLKPYIPTPELLHDLRQMRHGGVAMVVDSDHAICGAAEHAAYVLSMRTGREVHALGLADKTAGFAPALDNKTPSASTILDFIRERL